MSQTQVAEQTQEQINPELYPETNINFAEINLPIPQSIFKLPLEKQKEVYNYLIQMNEYQRKAYQIAQDHLGTSFNIVKSNGFIEWKKSTK